VNYPRYAEAEGIVGLQGLGIVSAEGQFTVEATNGSGVLCWIDLEDSRCSNRYALHQKEMGNAYSEVVPSHSGMFPMQSAQSIENLCPSVIR